MTSEPLRDEPQAGETIARLEADITYLEARLALLGQSRTPGQQAQYEVCRSLQGRLIEQLLYWRERSMRGGLAPSGAVGHGGMDPG